MMMMKKSLMAFSQSSIHRAFCDFSMVNGSHFYLVCRTKGLAIDSTPQEAYPLEIHTDYVQQYP